MATATEEHEAALPSRRAFFTSVGAAAVLSGCSSTDHRTDVPASSDPAPSAGSRGSGCVGAVAVARSSAPATRTQPTRKDIVATFAGREARYWGLQPPGVALGLPKGSRAIALTFDCCGGPGGDGFDRTLLSTLERHRIPATFFLNARWARANPALTRDLAANPLFEIGNHGTNHRPLSVTGRSAYGIPGTADPGSVYDEIMGAQAELTTATGSAPRFFRSGTAHYDEVAVQICRALGLVPVNFTVNSDAGATYPAAVVTSEILSAGWGSIIIAHANRPEAGTCAGVTAALARMNARGTRFVRLSDAPPR